VSLSEWRILAMLQEGPSTFARLVDATGVNKAPPHRSARELEQLHLVKISDTPDDARSTTLNLTSSGPEVARTGPTPGRSRHASSLAPRRVAGAPFDNAAPRKLPRHCSDGRRHRRALNTMSRQCVGHKAGGFHLSHESPQRVSCVHPPRLRRSHGLPDLHEAARQQLQARVVAAVGFELLPDAGGHVQLLFDEGPHHGR